MRQSLFAVCAVAVAFLASGALWAADPPTAKPKVVCIRYRLPPDNFDSAVAAMKAELAAKGLRDGEQVEIVDLLTATGGSDSTAEVQACVNQHKGDARAFVTFGWVSMPTRAILKETKVPQVCSFVFQPVAVNLVGGPLDKASGSAVTAIYLMYPPDKLLRILKQLMPEARRYGVVYDSTVPADVFFKKWHDELPSAQRQGVEYVFIDLAQGLEPAIAQIKDAKLDAYCGGVAFRKPANAALLKLGIPIISPKLDKLVEAGVKDTDEVAGYYNAPEGCGAQAGRLVADILGAGKDLGTVIPQPAEKQAVFINLDAAKRFKVKVPTALLGSGAVIIK